AGVIKVVYDTLTWLQNELQKIEGLFVMAGKIAGKIDGVVRGHPGVGDEMAADITKLLNDAFPLVLSFGAKQLGLEKMPKAIRETLDKVKSYPIGKVEKMLTVIVAKAKNKLNLAGADANPAFQGLLAPMIVKNANNEEHRLWLKEQNGKPVLMRASDPGELNLERDLPSGCIIRNDINTSVAALLTLGEQEIAIAKEILKLTAQDPRRTVLRNQLLEKSKLIKVKLEGLFTLLDTARIIPWYGQACFAAGTPLLVPGGSRNIEDIRVGDLVLSRDEHDANGEVQYKVVEEVFQRFSSIWELRAGGQLILTTGEHPFFRDGEWVAAQDLRVGDRLLCQDGSTITVEGNRPTDSWQPVYNLRIADWHTYFVGNDGWGFSVWAHNICWGDVLTNKGTDLVAVAERKRMVQAYAGGNSLKIHAHHIVLKKGYDGNDVRNPWIDKAKKILQSAGIEPYDI
ncbi:MAG: polymorphic toxin-type HINT domain-containing protein, partial [Gemmataceae bacterium]